MTESGCISYYYIIVKPVSLSLCLSLPKFEQKISTTSTTVTIATTTTATFTATYTTTAADQT